MDLSEKEVEAFFSELPIFPGRNLSSKARCQEINSRLQMAAYTEYTAMFKGSIRWASITELKIYRLMLLVKFVFDGIIPDEYQVGKILQITPASARNMLGKMNALYYAELEGAVLNTINLVLNTFTIDANDSGWFIGCIRSKQLLAQINDILHVHIPDVIKIKPVLNGASEYRIADHTLAHLKNFLQDKLGKMG